MHVVDGGGCMQVRECALVCRPEENSKYISSGALHLIVWDGISHWPNIHWMLFMLVIKPQGTACLCAISAETVNMNQCANLFFSTWVLRVKLSSLCVWSKHSTHWTTSNLFLLCSLKLRERSPSQKINVSWSLTKKISKAVTTQGIQ